MRFHGSQRRVQGVGHLLVGEAGAMTQADAQPLGGGQGPERGVEVEAHALLPFSARTALGRAVQGLLQPDPASEAADVEAGGDTIYPAGEAAFSSKVAGPLIRGQEGVL